MNSQPNRRSEQGVIKMTVKRACNDIILLYRLTEEVVEDELSCYNIAYSLTVTKVVCGGSQREVKRLYDISRNRREAERIFDMVSRGRVTPCTLSEVVHDLICI